MLLILFHAVIEVQLRHPGRLEFAASLNGFLSFLRMPLFTFLSGYLYATRPVQKAKRAYFLRRKAERLLIPLAFVSLLTVTAHAVVGSGSTAEIARNWMNELKTPSFHLWFLQAIFIILVALTLMGSLIRSVAGCLVILLVVAIAQALGMSEIRLFSFGQAIVLLPYFLAGVLAQYVFKDRVIMPSEIWLALAALLLVAVLRALQVEGLNVPTYRTSIPALIALFIVMPGLPILAALGRRSMAVYLYHALALAAVARYLPGPAEAVLLQLIVLGVGVPILLQIAAERWAPRTLPLLGRRRRHLR